MTDLFTEGEEFENINHSDNPLLKGEYENCTFTNCAFANADLSHFVFVDCAFINCDLSMISTNNTAFREVTFNNCKLLGVHFENCNDFLFSINFEHCQLNLASFYKRLLKKSLFKDCSLHEVDFAETDLTQAVFTNCDFRGAIFDQTNLQAADLRSSDNYSIDPERNTIKKAKFSINGIPGLLDKYDIHIE